MDATGNGTGSYAADAKADSSECISTNANNVSVLSFWTGFIPAKA
jgi:hypothetical protein